MVIQSQASVPHWSYFLAIERDLGEISRYIEFDERKFSCFSIEISKVLLSAGAETDIVCKQICKSLDASSRADSVGDYRKEIIRAFPSLPEFGVELPRFEITLKPWEEWSKRSGVPSWWTGYNKIKHHRHTHYQEANLKHALNAVAGLFVVVLLLYREIGNSVGLSPPPQLCMVDSVHYGGEEFGGWEALDYRI